MKRKQISYWKFKEPNSVIEYHFLCEDQYRMKTGIHFLVGSPRIERQNEQTLKDSVSARVESMYMSNYSYLLSQSGISLRT